LVCKRHGVGLTGYNDDYWKQNWPQDKLPVLRLLRMGVFFLFSPSTAARCIDQVENLTEVNQVSV